MDNRANEAYLIAIINSYEREINKVKTETVKTNTLKNVVSNLGDLFEFMKDNTIKESKSTLELNKDLIENVRAYKISLAVERRVVDSLKIDLNDKIMDLHKNGYIEQENKMLESDNSKLNNQLALQETKRKELFHECWEAEIENGKHIIEIQELNKENLDLKSTLAMTNVNENAIRGLKSDIQIWQAQCIELREKLEKATKCQWWID